MPGLAFLGIGVGILLALLTTKVFGDGAHKAAMSTNVGMLPPKPPSARVGKPVFALPQRMWGKCECCKRGANGWQYGVRFPGGTAVVLGEDEVVR